MKNGRKKSEKEAAERMGGPVNESEGKKMGQREANPRRRGHNRVPLKIGFTAESLGESIRGSNLKFSRISKEFPTRWNAGNLRLPSPGFVKKHPHIL
jgi:hypothetical protein